MTPRETGSSEIVAVPGRDDAWRVDDVEFVRSFGFESTPMRFCIRKRGSLIALYSEICREFAGGRIVELGIADGGSTALLALAARPSLLVACELDREPRPALQAMIDARGLSGVVHPYYGIDQGDRGRLSALVAAERDGAPLDLVIDDASHLYEPTLASFEVIFPSLRPGGLYVIEDWAAEYAYAEGVTRILNDPADGRRGALERRLGDIKHQEDSGTLAPALPLPRLALQLQLAAVASPGTVASVSIDHHWLSVRRGPAPCEPEAFRLSDLYVDHFGWVDH